MNSDSITLVILDSLVDKVRQFNIVAYVPTQQEIDEQVDQELSDWIDSQVYRPFTHEDALEEALSGITWPHPNSIDHSIPTGDAALDYDSDMDDCLIPADSDEEELIPTEEIIDEFDDDTDVDSENEDILATIDFTEEINLSDLYC